MRTEKVTVRDLVGKNGKLCNTGKQVNSLLHDNVGRFVKITIEFQDEQPTISQYGYLFGCVYVEMRNFIAETQGLYVPIEQIDIECKKSFFWSDEINEQDLRCEAEPKKKSKNSKTALSCYIDSIIEALEMQGWRVPTPHEYSLAWIEKKESKKVYRGKIKFNNL